MFPEVLHVATIVLTDDNRDLLEVFKMLLESLNYIVRAFQDPVQALSSIRQEKCDLVMTDLHMPTMNGLELKERIEDECCAVPVLIMSNDLERPPTILNKMDLINPEVLAQTINHELVRGGGNEKTNSHRR